MQYLLLCYFDEAHWERLPDEQRAKIVREQNEFMQTIVKSGHYRANAKLKPTKATATVRSERGRPSVCEGGETAAPQLSGYFLIDCRDRLEAIGIAERVPIVSAGGRVEVRPVEPITRQ